MTEAQAIALVGSIFAVVYGAIQIGDRLWRKEKPEPDTREVEARLSTLITSTAQLSATTTALSQAVMQLIADRHAERQIAEARHQELIRVLSELKGRE